MPNYATLNTKKYLDAAGLTYFSQKLNNYPTNDVIYAVIEGVQDALDEKVDDTSVGAASGIATLDSEGKLTSTQVPASVQDVYEYSSYSLFPLTGSTDKLYIDASTNCTYRWTGSAYTQVGTPAPTVISDAEIDALFA